MFQKAVKSESKLKMAIEGVSGSGKTFTALTIATALGKTAVLDTESGSASKYADRFSFDVVNMTAPYTPARYVEIINAAANAGYEVLVIDSLSHAWFADGGVLDIVDKAARRSQSKNTYVAWAEGTPAHNALINAIVAAPIHIIGTMRSKSDYIMVDNGRGKEAPKKVGMAPIQRDGFEYEFDVTAKMTIDNELMIEKTRLFSLQGLVMSKPTAELAQLIKADLSGQPDDRPRYANHVLVDGAAIPYYTDYMKLHDTPPATADDLREWYKASKAKAAQPSPEATATAVQDDAPPEEQEQADSPPLAGDTHRLALATKAAPNVGDVIAALSNDGRAKPDYSRETIKAEWEPITGKAITPATKITVETALKMYDFVVGSMF